MIEKLGGRKYILTILASILLFVLVMVNKITAKEFIDFMIANIGIYGLANTIQKFSPKK